MQAHGMTWLRCWTVAISFNGTRFDLTTISVFLGFAFSVPDSSFESEQHMCLQTSGRPGRVATKYALSCAAGKNQSSAGRLCSTYACQHKS